MIGRDGPGFLSMCDSHPSLIKGCCCFCVLPLVPPSFSLSFIHPYLSLSRSLSLCLSFCCFCCYRKRHAALHCTAGKAPGSQPLLLFSFSYFSRFLCVSSAHTHTLPDENVRGGRDSVERVRCADVGMTCVSHSVGRVWDALWMWLLLPCFHSHVMFVFSTPVSQACGQTRSIYCRSCSFLLFPGSP